MKSGIHPEYREVVFVDTSNDFSFVSRSTVQTRETVVWKDGKEYPLCKLDTSAESHPFYTGAQTRIVETGRVEKFRQKFAAKSQAVKVAAEAAAAAAAAQHAAATKKKK
jgi:large subunit ribosomal protein L31